MSWWRRNRKPFFVTLAVINAACFANALALHDAGSAWFSGCITLMCVFSAYRNVEEDDDDSGAL